MDSWNYTNVWVPASAYAEQHNSVGAAWRENESKSWNESLDAPDGPRQEAAECIK